MTNVYPNTAQGEKPTNPANSMDDAQEIERRGFILGTIDDFWFHLLSSPFT